MKFKLAKTFYRVMLWWIVLWSKTYRFFWQPKRKYVKSPLETNHSPVTAWNKIRVLEYRKDDWKVLRDVFNRPEHVQMSINCKKSFGVQLDGQMDCDDYAVWCANVLARKWHPMILCVIYKYKDGDLSGHAVCLAQNHQTGKYFHVGNWGVWGPYDSFNQAISSILSKRSILIGWSLFSPDLKLLKWSKKLPK